LDRVPSEALPASAEADAEILSPSSNLAAAKLFTIGAGDGEGFEVAFLRRLGITLETVSVELGNALAHEVVLRPTPFISPSQATNCARRF
jgi:hypothetical protein